MPLSETYNIDCMEYMRTLPDKYFKYGLLDPPYGLGIDGQKLSNNNKNRKHNRKKHEFRGWDSQIPAAEYFIEVKRVCEYLIIFGGNYFTEYLAPVKSWIIWYKGQQGLTMSDAELIWTNLEIVTRVITVNRFELAKQNSIHPTEKPIILYKKILSFLTPGDKILDTHLGSGSSRIAAYDLCFDFVGTELDKDYFEAQEKRFATHIAQQRLFAPVQETPTQITLL